MILFVCLGNVARSQFAEAFAQKRGIVDVASAGTHVPPERQGNRLKDDGTTGRMAVQAFLVSTGIDLSEKRRKPLTPELVSAATRIIVLTGSSNLPDYVGAYSDKVEFWDIEDPHGMSIDVYLGVIDRIRSKIDDLFESGRPRPRSAGPL